MATREPRDRNRRTVESVRSTAPTRYDLVLAAIPLAFVVSMLAGHVLSLPPETSVVIASLVSLLVLVDGLLVNPPGSEQQ